MKTDNKEDEKKLDETKVENSATTQKTEPEKKDGGQTTEDGEDTKETKPAEVTNPATTQNTCSEENKETQNTETTQNACGDDADKKPVENACSDDKDGEDTDGDDKDETPTENSATTQKTEPEKKDGGQATEEVISLEVLNQAPEKKVEQTVTENDKLKKALSLKGKAFFDYLKANPELR